MKNLFTTLPSTQRAAKRQITSIVGAGCGAFTKGILGERLDVGAAASRPGEPSKATSTCLAGSSPAARTSKPSVTSAIDWSSWTTKFIITTLCDNLYYRCIPVCYAP